MRIWFQACGQLQTALPAMTSCRWHGPVSDCLVFSLQSNCGVVTSSVLQYWCRWKGGDRDYLSCHKGASLAPEIFMLHACPCWVPLKVSQWRRQHTTTKVWRQRYTGLPAPPYLAISIDLSGAAGISMLGPIEEKFVEVTEVMEPLESGQRDKCFVSKGYDATSHFETTVEDVLELYSRITGKVGLLGCICLMPAVFNAPHW